MNEKLLGILTKVRPDIKFETAEGLILEEILDSFDILAIVAAILDELGIDIPVECINAENFDSLKEMEKLIDGLQKKETPS